MGSGKTRQGKMLAEERGCHFIDLDELIETSEQKSIPDIFASQGEEEFRTLERQYLHQTNHSENTIIACGGGTPCFFDNISWMKSHGKVIYLKVSEQVLFDRLSEEKNHRPLISDLSDEELKTFISLTLNTRAPYYEKADEIWA